MSKIVKNTTQSPYTITDVGITIPASSQYVIPTIDYLLWAASSDVIVGIGTEDLVINDGSFDLSISDGTDLIKGLFPNPVGIKGSGGTQIGNSGDRLKVEAQLTTGNGDNIINFPESDRDGFGKLRVSSSLKLQSYSSQYCDCYVSTLTKRTSGSGSVTRDNTSSFQVLSVGTTSGDKAVLQSRRYIQYNKGNSQTCFLSLKTDVLKTNLVQRWGFFDDDNGIFFQQKNNDFSLVIRSSINALGDTEIARSNWNIDKLDGTGPSGLTYNFGKHTLYELKYGWLSSAGIIFSVYLDGILVPIHKQIYSNNTEVPYTLSGNLPWRVEIENIGTTTSASTLKLACVSTHTEGGSVREGFLNNLSTATTSKSINDISYTIIAGIRIKSTSRYASAKPIQFEIIPQTGNDNAYYEVIYNPTLVNASWSSVNENIEGLVSATSFSGGKVLDSGYIQLGNKNTKGIGKETFLLNDQYIGKDIDGNSDALIIVFKTISGSGSLLFSGFWEEYT